MNLSINLGLSLFGSWLTGRWLYWVMWADGVADASSLWCPHTYSLYFTWVIQRSLNVVLWTFYFVVRLQKLKLFFKNTTWGRSNDNQKKLSHKKFASKFYLIIEQQNSITGMTMPHFGGQAKGLTLRHHPPMGTIAPIILKNINW